MLLKHLEVFGPLCFRCWRFKLFLIQTLLNKSPFVWAETTFWLFWFLLLHGHRKRNTHRDHRVPRVSKLLLLCFQQTLHLLTSRRHGFGLSLPADRGNVHQTERSVLYERNISVVMGERAAQFPGLTPADFSVDLVFVCVCCLIWHKTGKIHTVINDCDFNGKKLKIRQ